jgi:hypothetical protein
VSTDEPLIIKDDIDHLLRLIRPFDRGVVSIDGCAGCGKTTLMRELAGHLNCSTVDLDDFLERKQGHFIQALRLNELQDALQKAETGLVLVAGVCVLEALAHSGREAALTIYVQRISKAGKPGDDWILNAEDEGSDEPIEPDSPGALDRELRSYHARFRPRRRADVLYHRTEEDLLPLVTPQRNPGRA